MKLLEILLGQIPEAIYFALFMVYAKSLNTKRVLFVLLMVIEYVLLLNVLPFSIWSHILYFVVTYVTLKVLYKEKSQITDIFTLGIASLVLMLISVVCYFIMFIIVQDIVVSTLLAKILLFMFLYMTNTKLSNIQKLYKRLWNRNDKLPKLMKSVTFRCINIVLFNIMFYLINCFILFAIFWYGGE